MTQTRWRVTGQRDPLVEVLREAREAAGMTQRQLAVRLGSRWSQTAVSQWESGQKLPGLRSLRRWADTLGFDVVLAPRQDGDQP